MFRSLAIAAAAATAAANELVDSDVSVGTGVFEANLRTHPSAARARAAAADDKKKIASDIDVRVARAMGSRGYGKLRLSVVTDGPRDLGFDFDYAAPFRYRWTAAYDLGVEAASCGAGVYARVRGAEGDGDCLRACSADDACEFFSYRRDAMACDLASTCDYADDATVEATYAKLQRNYLHSTLVDAKAGKNTYTVGGHEVTVNLPEEDGFVSGIIWSDPCFSSRWINCAYRDRFDAFNRSVEMLNVLAEDDSWHFFQVLGDSFYDQDGRLSKKLFDGLSLKVKSKLLYAVSGNHDLWVCGVPDCGGELDQWGIGTMQWYAQDPISEGFLDFAVDPDAQQDWDIVQNDPKNLFWYNKLGNVGFIGYSGGSSWEEMKPDFQEACAFMGSEGGPDVVVLLGHWNDRGMGCEQDMTVPAVRKEILELPGCSAFGDRLKAFDGHKHCNYVQETGADGKGNIFMIGAHGMEDHCDPQYGFAYVESDATSYRVYYFEEQNATEDNYEALKACFDAKGVAGCKDMAATWLEMEDPHLTAVDAVDADAATAQA